MEADRASPARLFSRDEIRALTRRSDLHGGWAVLGNWLIILAAFAVAIRWPGPLSFVFAVVVVGCRQLGLAVLQHEAAHYTLFRSRWLNEFTGEWLAAKPIWLSMVKYRAHHRIHHRSTGTREDSDYSLRAPFPASRASLTRKLLRDISGLTGLKLSVGLLLMDLGVLKWTVATDVERLPQEGRNWGDYLGALIRNTGPVVCCNAVLFCLLYAAGAAWAYSIWVLAFLTVFPTVTRIRSIAEHGCMEESPDMFRNTRTTQAGWLARLTVAPMYVNYHLEHHLLPSVPFYRLPLMHRLLQQKGLAPPAPSYFEVMKLAASG